MIKRILFLLSFFIYFSLIIGVSKVRAQIPDWCYTSGYNGLCWNGFCNPTDMDCCDTYAVQSDCSVGNGCSTSICGATPADVCCLPGVSCPGGRPTWTFAHDAVCKVTSFDTMFGLPDCAFEW